MTRIAQADALLIATPEFNTALPGQLKHLVDWGSRPYGPEAKLYGKPVAVIGASKTAYGAMWAQDQLRKALAIAGARVTEVDLSVGDGPSKFDDNSDLTDQATLEQAGARCARAGRASPPGRGSLGGTDGSPGRDRSCRIDRGGHCHRWRPTHRPEP